MSISLTVIPDSLIKVMVFYDFTVINLYAISYLVVLTGTLEMHNRPADK